MRCEEFRANVVAFHFGEVDEAERASAEAHLAGCGACLADFLAVKRDVEAPVAEERPSAAAKSKLKRAVAAEVGATVVRPWQWWERPLALALAGAAALLAISLVGAVGTSDGRQPVTMELSRPPAR